MWPHHVQQKLVDPSYVKIIENDRIIQFPLIGVKELDRDHIEIIRLLDVLVKGNNVKDYLLFSSNALSYIYHHIKLEEEYMERIHYPGIRIHKVAHVALKNVIQVLLKESNLNIERRNVARVHQEAVEECKGIFHFHIMNHDLPLSKYIKYQKINLDSFGVT